MIDSDGFRFNVGIILCNADGKVFWAKRNGQDAWQFPQGGIRADETPKEALFRELFEEVGLLEDHVQIMGCTRKWLYYRLPHYLVRRNKRPLCIGQKQIWFSLRLIGSENDVRLNMCDRPEFDCWRWVNYWYPLKEVVFFKRKVYAKALRELAPLIKDSPSAAAPAAPKGKPALLDPLRSPLSACCSSRVSLVRL